MTGMVSRADLRWPGSVVLGGGDLWLSAGVRGWLFFLLVWQGKSHDRRCNRTRARVAGLVAAGERDLTVAVTGPTGTFGFGLVPLLVADDRVARIVGIARRPFDPAAHGWTKMEYRRGDVRDPDALRDAFDGADVVVHLAFLVTGAASAEAIRAINVTGTLNAFRAAAAAGARRFVYASSVAAYGFHPDNPVGMTEEWPVRPAARLFYAQEKAELERLLQAEAAVRGARPVPAAPAHRAGPARGGREEPAAWPARAARPQPGPARRRPPGAGAGACARAALAVRARRRPGTGVCAVHRGGRPAGAYNIAADGILTATDVAREFGLLPLPLPAGPAQLAARAMAALPFLPPAATWVEAASHPSIVDATRARTELGWTPRFTALEALRDTVRAGLAGSLACRRLDYGIVPLIHM